MTSQRDISTPALVALATLGAGLAGALGFALEGGWKLEGAAAAARFTARFSFLWFVVAFSASALARLWPGGWRAVTLRRRRAIGLGFAAAHFVHLAALLTVVAVFASPVSATTVIGGGGAYVFIAAMALTSNDASVRMLGLRNWKLLHTVGVHSVAFVFFVSYLGRLEDKPWLGIPALALLGGAMVLRIAAWVKRSRGAAAV